MKRGGVKLRAKELSLMLIVIICTTIIMWTWDRTPLLTSFLPPKDIVEVNSRISQESSKSEIEMHDISSHVEDETVHIKDEEENEKPEETSETGGSLSDSIRLVTEDTSVNTAEETTQKHNLVEEDDSNAETESTERNLDIEVDPKVDLGRKSSGQGREISDGIGSVEKESLLIRNYDQNRTVAKEHKGCNYAKGKWVIDDSRPLYSGFGCKRWLASMWACRLMQRDDFVFEKLRWQPKDCQMEDFEGAKFLRRMKDKTLAFVGDSLGRQQFQSMMCMITGGDETSQVLDVGKEFGLITPKGGNRPSGWAYRFPETNTTVLYYWSATLCELEPIADGYAMHLDRPPTFLKTYLHKIDVLVLNTGHHWNRGKLNANKWVVHVGGVPNTNKKLNPIGNAKNFTVHSIVKWVNLQLPKHPHLKAFYRSISPRHFVNGDWNTGGSCNNTTPMSIGKMVLQDESSDHGAGSATKGTGVKLLDITAVSQVRDEGHISRFSLTASPGVQDCLHWCLPGVPDTWNEILFAQI